MILALLIFAQVVTIPAPSDVIFQSVGETILTFKANGEIIVHHPEKLDETAKKFLEIVKYQLPIVCGCKEKK